MAWSNVYFHLLTENSCDRLTFRKQQQNRIKNTSESRHHDGSSQLQPHKTLHFVFASGHHFTYIKTSTVISVAVSRALDAPRRKYEASRCGGEGALSRAPSGCYRIRWARTRPPFRCPTPNCLQYTAGVMHIITGNCSALTSI